MISAIVVALLSAAFFALGSGLQHRAAGTVTKDSKRGMMAGLLRRPGWLIGVVCCALAFGLQAFALKLGAITVVQPILLSGIVFTVAIRPALDRRLPARGDLGWVALTWAGLALFIAVLPRAPEQPARMGAALVLVAAGLAGVAVLVLIAHRAQVSPLIRGVLLGCASGILFGLVAGLLKLSTAALDRGLLGLFAHWPFWVLLAIGGCAVLLNQRAYQETEMSVSTPVLNICQLLVSLAFGVFVLAEQLFASPLNAVLELIGLAIMVLGVIKLTTRAADEPPPVADSAADTPDDADSPAQSATRSS